MNKITINVPDDKLLSSKDAAVLVGLRPVTILAHIRQGHLKATLLGSRYIIKGKDLKEFQKNRRKPGRQFWLEDKFCEEKELPPQAIESFKDYVSERKAELDKPEKPFRLERRFLDKWFEEWGKTVSIA